MEENVIIHIEQLSKIYKNSEHYAVQDLSLDIKQGEIFGLLGPNGAGKTTLISMLCGLLKSSSGQFTIAGRSYRTDGVFVRKIIGVVPQEYALYPTLTAYENLMYFGAMYGLRGTTLKETVISSLDKMGLSPFAYKAISTFSGGMKRRVNLLAGVLHQPKVLFLDEPTVGVDVQSKHAIIDFLEEINRTGTTIVYTSHHLIEAQEFCDQIAIIEGGQIIAKGTPKTLIENTKDARNLEDVFIALTGRGFRDAI